MAVDTVISNIVKEVGKLKQILRSAMCDHDAGFVPRSVITELPGKEARVDALLRFIDGSASDSATLKDHQKGRVPDTFFRRHGKLLAEIAFPGNIVTDCPEDVAIDTLEAILLRKGYRLHSPTTTWRCAVGDVPKKAASKPSLADDKLTIMSGLYEDVLRRHWSFNGSGYVEPDYLRSEAAS